MPEREERLRHASRRARAPQCVINVGTVSAPTASMLVPAACRLVRPKTDDEQRHQQEAATVGEQPGEHADGERRRQHDRRAVAPGAAARRVVDRIGHQHAGADDEQHEARQQQAGLDRRRVTTPTRRRSCRVGRRRLRDRPAACRGRRRETTRRAPISAAGSIAGSGEATAATPGTPMSARIGVAKADPPAPNRPNTMPMPSPGEQQHGVVHRLQ